MQLLTEAAFSAGKQMPRIFLYLRQSIPLHISTGYEAFALTLRISCQSLIQSSQNSSCYSKSGTFFHSYETAYSFVVLASQCSRIDQYYHFYESV